MNLILFEAGEIDQPLPLADPRARHVLHVLRRQKGETFDAGIINGPRGKGTVTAVTPAALAWSFAPAMPAPMPIPITVIVGLPRPQTARDVLRDASTLGIGALHFVRTEKGDPNYAQSTLWSSGEWRRHAIAGAEQAFDTRIPDVTSGRMLAEVLDAPSATDPVRTARCRLAFDNYEAGRSLFDTNLPRAAHAVLALGAERGWSAAERDTLRAHGFEFVHLGSRVLRTETAVVAALTVVRAKLGLM